MVMPTAVAAVSIALTVLGPFSPSDPGPTGRGGDPPVTSVITVPMSTHVGRTGPSTDTDVPGDCGTAYIYLARVNGDETRVTYGFKALRYRAIGYTAGADFSNEDTGDVATDRASGGLALRTSFERSVTKFTNSGEVVVYGHLHSIGATHDCYSSPALFDSIYVY